MTQLNSADAQKSTRPTRPAYQPKDPLLNFGEACVETRRAPSTAFRDRALGNFPMPDAWNGRRPLWRRSTLHAFMAGTAARRA